MNDRPCHLSRSLIRLSIGAINDNMGFESNVEQSRGSPRRIHRRGLRRGSRQRSRRPTSSRRLLPPEERHVYLFLRKCRFVPRYPRLPDGRGFGRAQKSSKRVLRNAVPRGGEHLLSSVCRAFSGVGRFISRILTDTATRYRPLRRLGP